MGLLFRKVNFNHQSPDTTTLLESSLLTTPTFSPSPFTNHALQTVQFRNRESHQLQPDWILGILVSGFILLAWAQVFYHRRVRQVFQAPFSKRFINQLIRDGNLFKERVSVALGTLYLLTFSLLLYQVNEMILHTAFFHLPPWGIYSLILLGVTCYWLGKIITIQFLSVVFNTMTTTRAYLLNTLIFCLIIGILLLPLLVLVLYLKSILILWICLICFTLIFIFRVMRGFFIGISLTKFSYLFLFVYLCSLEFLPLLVLVKIFLIYM